MFVSSKSKPAHREHEHGMSEAISNSLTSAIDGAGGDSSDPKNLV